MSYQIIDEKIVGKTVSADGSFMQMKLMHIVCDAAADIPAPEPAWSAGSRCDVLEDSGSVRLLSSAREWMPVNFYNWSGDGGGAAPDLKNYYTKPQTDARINEKVAEIVADAPEDFNTLKEMSDWISQHEESAAAMNTAIQGKVDKIAGKQLSTENYTTAEKTKLSGIETGANKTTVDSALNASSTNPVQNKLVKENFDKLYEMIESKKQGQRTTDINATKEPGVYRFYGNNGTSNLPSDITAASPFGMLEVSAMDEYCKQVLTHFISGSPAAPPVIYVRRSVDSGTTWSPWGKIEGTAITTQ